MALQSGDALSDDAASIPIRPLILGSAATRISIPVSTSTNDWIAAEVLRDAFLHSAAQNQDVAPADEPQNAQISFFAQFLRFLASNAESSPPHTSVLSSALTQFTTQYLSTVDIHTLTSSFPPDTRKDILTGYFAALAVLESRVASTEEVPRAPRSALLNAAKSGNASIYGLFGGQGTNEVYFAEFKALYETYKPYVAELVARVTNQVLIPAADKATNVDGYSYYSHGLDVLSWLQGPEEAQPPVEYLASIPISFPLIGLAQLVQYLVAVKVNNLTPGSFRALVHGATGHSQGIVSAVVLATSTTEESFILNSIKASKWLFYSGLRGQEAFPVLALEPRIAQDAIEGAEGYPAPMLAVSGLARSTLESHITKTNAHLPENAQLSVGLQNGAKVAVVVGPARSLYGLVTALRKIRAPAGADQSKVPYSQRKIVFSMRFLAVNVPYHSNYLQGVTEKVFEIDLEGKELWTPEELAIPVYHTNDGSDLRKITTSLTRSLCDQTFILPLHWLKATNFPDTATHAIDFGPGGLSGIGPLTVRNFEGRGIRVIVLGEKGEGGAELYDVKRVKYEDWWSKKWTPKLVKTRDGKVQIDSPFSRLLGKPPVMVAGMTPSTVKAGFVSAILSAGYHVELAGGGHYNTAAVRAKVAEIRSLIPPGVGITLNSLYINPRQFGFQFPLWQEMKGEGLPIEGFCVAAGIPSTEKAAEIIGALRDAGIKHVAFKPGSVEGIRQVVAIAATNPDYPIIMQWTGGRAGGHHSYEDFHQPILATYVSIRSQPNISLVAGSGFGDGEGVWPYITGEWAVEYGAQPMPFDGVLFGSWAMIAKEAHTSDSVKELLVQAQGVDDDKWEQTYKGETGGVLTVQSELGEPIHKIATRAIKLWKEFDETIFKLAKDKRQAWLNANADSVIEKLNRDFAKPWFAQKKDGTVVKDLGDLTYEETVLRLVRLMYVKHQSRWIDISLRNLLGDWLRRVEERFAGVNGKPKQSILQSYNSLNDPEPFIATFLSTYPEACQQLLAAEDKKYFLSIAQRPGQKPAPFIPVLDVNFEVWFKKDSLWAAEDIDAVFDQDPQRVAILQGPVAVKHARVANRPIKEMLGGVEDYIIKKLLEEYYGNDESKVPYVDYIGSVPAKINPTLATSYGIDVKSDKASKTYKFALSLPPVDEWLETLVGPEVTWLRALLRSENIVQKSGYITNPLKRLFSPRAGQTVTVKYDAAGAPVGVSLYGAARSFGAHKPIFEAAAVTYNARASSITVVVNEDSQDATIPLEFTFIYRPDQGFAPIHEVTEGRNKRIKAFYWRLWFDQNQALPEGVDLHDELVGPEVTITAAAIERFCDVVGNQGERFKTSRNPNVEAPMDFAIVTGWQSIMQAIFPESVDGDLLKLVHLSNGFKILNSARPFRVGDKCRSAAKIIAVTNNDSGKTVTVTGHVLRDGEPVIEVRSSFLYRGRFSDYENTFQIVDEPDFVVELNDASAVGVLQSKEWFDWDNDAKPLLPGTKLIFRVQTEVAYKNKTTYSSVNITGKVYVRDQLKTLIPVATVDFTNGVSIGNPVTAYLQRHGVAQDQPVLFENAYTLTNADLPATFTAPATNEPYSQTSGDYNPIHINPYFSDFAALPGTITHGMWSSAATRKYVETVVAQGKPERVIAYDVTFVGMVLPRDELSVKLSHTGMRNGNMVIKVETTNQRGEKIIDGTAEVAQPPTVYVFTGQGSQEPGMGMDLYNSSPAARAVWDAADEHLLAVYGFSIIDIVKHNPKEKTIHFGGIKGQAIRQRYIDMTYDTLDKDGNVKTLPLFTDINVRTQRYTFSHPNGLLFATQFAQIALVVTEKAAFDDMRSKGLIQRDSAFAGHSLGEYSALASIADVLPISSLVDVVFYRGITMQSAVERDSQNRSNYAMCAVNPSRISKTFNEAALREVVEIVSRRADALLEIVNYNVDGSQYVAAGDLLALQTITNVLNYLKKENIDLQKLLKTFSVEKIKSMLQDIVDNSFEAAKKQKAAQGGYITLERGIATIPLPGIDVPFHSRYLWAGVLPFRAYLSRKINSAHLNPDLLVGKYIPNLIATPFQVTKEYAQILYDQTSSPSLDKVLKNWEQDNWDHPSMRQKLAYTILVELLAYQFASPVRWIETQDLLFTNYKFERLIELGPGPTLTGMATRTLKAKYEASDDSVSLTRAIYCHAKNPKEIYYQFEDEVAEPETAPDLASTSEPTAVAVVAAAPVAAPAPSAGPAAAIADEPLKAVDTLRVIIAQKLKKKVEEIPLSKSIKDLVGGKSTLQNEILGDLNLEFTTAPEKGEELPLDELGSSLGSGYSGQLGKHTTGLVSRLVGGKMPGGFNLTSIKGHLNKTWGLGPLRSDGVLLLGLTMEPPKRLGSEAEAKTWLDGITAAYAQSAGISLSSGGGAAGGGGAGGGPVVNSEEFIKFQAAQHEFAKQQVELYMRYLDLDTRAGHSAADVEKGNVNALQAKLDAISREHGDTYIDGIQPVFEPLKARHFDSSWNWVRQDALLMWYDILHGRISTVDRDITARCIAIINRADDTLLEYMQYYVDRCDPSRGETYRLGKEFGQKLIDNCREALGRPPLYKDVTFPTAPHTEVTAQGDIVYSEVVREGVRKLEAYVEEMATGGPPPTAVNIDKVQEDVLKLWNVVKSQAEISQEQKNRIKALYDGVVRSLRKSSTTETRRVTPRTRRSSSQFLRPQVVVPTTLADDKIPLLHLKRKSAGTWEYSSNLTSVYLDVLNEIATSGTTFKDKNALLTGVGKGSIGVEILKGLLSGGAHVVITTSRYSRKTVEYYQGIFQTHGSRGSALTVVPFNQGSKQDVDALVDYIYSTLNLDLDYVLPFAAIPENGREIDGLDDKSELAHRVMLVNLLRLLGAVKQKKASRNFVTRPTQVVLPLSPNHGLFGNDGLYSESKISLETLFTRWSSESWGEYLGLAGAVIGWTRGTGLMSASNVVAQHVESHGVRTYSAKEMAFNILGLMHPLLFSITQVEPIWADLNGGMDRLPDLADITVRSRQEINAESSLRKAISRDNALDYKITNGPDAEAVLRNVPVTPRANFKFEFPKPELPESLADLSHLHGLIDLEKVVVIAGFAEVGPWGSSRTRWEMEARGEFTIEGCIEMAWIMGFIRHFDGKLPNGSLYVGWVDAKSGDPVDDKDVKAKYEANILAHSGIRLIEPDLFKGYDPKRKGFNQEVELTHDLEPMEVSEEEAAKFKLEHGDKCDAWTQTSGEWFVKFKKGARILVPKAVSFSRLVAGQLPTGWDAGRYGIPADIIAQTDRTALWALVCTAEALIMAGINDPYELYQHVHPSEVGTSVGSGMGGMESLSAMFRDRREEKDVQKDILQETFINTVAGWVNLLLMSSSGPVKIPVGACATALQSLEIACDTILSGKAKVMIAGGFDDFSEEGSYEFANMGATSNSHTEFAMGREPNEMSRPTASTRDGFMEAQGCGVQVVMSAKTAIDLGATIRGIVAFTSTSTDKAGRSVPAPGKGVLTIARQLSPNTNLPILDVAYRSRQLQFRRKQIAQWLENEHELLKLEVESVAEEGKDEFLSERIALIESEAVRQEKDALATFGMLVGHDDRVAPLRRALAVWGLTPDDLGVVSIHGTSTQANEKNETSVYNDVFTNIGRTPGNAVPVIAQKNLTGHPKGGAAAWMLGGLCQSVITGIIPGNRNADNVDTRLQAHKYLLFPSKTIHTDGIKAGIMTSFGFGQVGGVAVIIHPRYLWGTVEPSAYTKYRELNRGRALASYKSMSEMMIANNLVKIKEHPPYTAELEAPVLLNSRARATPDKTGSYAFTNKLPKTVEVDSGNLELASRLLANSDVAGVGVDQELISSVPSWNPTFVSRNYTEAEATYCRSQPNPPASFAARWAGKEAVFKSLGVAGKGAAASLRDIEILPDAAGAPQVTLRGDAQAAAVGKGIKKVLVSLSHSDSVAIAFAQASA